jgi:hypothetical protein
MLMFASHLSRRLDARKPRLVMLQLDSAIRSPALATVRLRLGPQAQPYGRGLPPDAAAQTCTESWITFDIHQKSRRFHLMNHGIPCAAISSRHRANDDDDDGDDDDDSTNTTTTMVVMMMMIVSSQTTCHPPGL